MNLSSNKENKLIDSVDEKYFLKLLEEKMTLESEVLSLQDQVRAQFIDEFTKSIDNNLSPDPVTEYLNLIEAEIEKCKLTKGEENQCENNQCSIIREAIEEINNKLKILKYFKQ